MVERKSKSRGLGRGLSSLMGDLNNEPLTSNENSESQTIEKLVPVEKIYPNPNQPRKSFQEEKLIELANSLPYSFQASILSRNLDFILRCNRRIDAATIMVNDHTAYRVDWMPFAGLKQSGYGVGGIPFTFEDMQIEKLTIVRSLEL